MNDCSNDTSIEQTRAGRRKCNTVTTSEVKEGACFMTYCIVLPYSEHVLINFIVLNALEGVLEPHRALKQALQPADPCLLVERVAVTNNVCVTAVLVVRMLGLTARARDSRQFSQATQNI